jgi:hypothetical protein
LQLKQGAQVQALFIIATEELNLGSSSRRNIVNPFRF